MTTLTAVALGGVWTTAATWSPAQTPVAGDDCILALTSGAVSIPAGSVCRSLVATNHISSLTFSSGGNLAVGDGSGGALTLGAGMTVTLSGGTLSLVSTSNNGGAGWGVTCAGKVLPATTFNGAGGKWVLQDAFSCGTGTLTVTSGGFFGNGQTITAGAIVGAGALARTIDITNCAVNLSTAGTSWGPGTSGSLTFVSTGSTITCTGASTTFTDASLAYATVVFTGSGTPSLNTGAATFVNLTRTGTAVKTDGFSLVSNIVVTGTLTLGGNTTQGVNRLLVRSSVRGTQCTINCTGGSVVMIGDADFMDINITGSPSWTNTGSKWVGDALGNGSLITTNRTTPATQTATGTASFAWSTHGWTSRVPLPQDNVSIPNAFIATRVITVDMPRLGADITCTCTGSPTFAVSLATRLHGSLTFAAGMSYTGAFSVEFAGRSASTLTTAGVQFPHQYDITMPNGTLTLQDAFVGTRSGNVLEVKAGTFIDNGQNVTFTGAAATFAQTGGTVTKTGAWSFSTTGAVVFWNVTGGTVTDTGSITLTAASASIRTFAGGGKTYGTLTYIVPGSTGSLSITGAATMLMAINFSDVTNARTLTLPATNGITITTADGFNVQGTAGKLMTVTGDVASALAQHVNYASISGSDASGGGRFVAYNSTDGGTNTGWLFRSLVTDTLNPQWAVRALVADTVNPRWAVRGLAADALDLRWATRSLTGPDAVALAWAVRGLVLDTLDARWAVRSLTGADALALQWAVRALAGDATSIRWDTRAHATSPLDLRWDVRATVTDTLALAWAIRALAADQTELQWATRVITGGDTLTLTWATRSTISDDLELIWRVSFGPDRQIQLAVVKVRKRWTVEAVRRAP